MLDVEYYRETVLEIALTGKHVSKHVAELRLLLFVHAAYEAEYNMFVLKPFPPCFYNKVTKRREYAELLNHVHSIPLLSEFAESTTLPDLTWELLYWIFTNPLDIQAVTESEISNFIIGELREETKLSDIPQPEEGHCVLFEINHVKKAFVDAKKNFGSFYGYHGSPLDNFHSIIHNGLLGCLNIRSAYGSGTYLSTVFRVSRSYSEVSKPLRSRIIKSADFKTNELSTNVPSASQPNTVNESINQVSSISSVGVPSTNDQSQSNNPLIPYSMRLPQVNAYLRRRLTCVAIVEVANDPAIKAVDFKCAGKYYVVKNDDCMQLRKLLVFY